MPAIAFKNIARKMITGVSGAIAAVIGKCANPNISAEKIIVDHTIHAWGRLLFL